MTCTWAISCLLWRWQDLFGMLSVFVIFSSLCGGTGQAKRRSGAPRGPGEHSRSFGGRTSCWISICVLLCVCRHGQRQRWSVCFLVLLKAGGQSKFPHVQTFEAVCGREPQQQAQLLHLRRVAKAHVFIEMFTHMWFEAVCSSKQLYIYIYVSIYIYMYICIYIYTSIHIYIYTLCPRSVFLGVTPS